MIVQRGDHERTVRAFKAIVDQEPDDSLSWNNLGASNNCYAGCKTTRCGYRIAQQRALLLVQVSRGCGMLANL